MGQASSDPVVDPVWPTAGVADDVAHDRCSQEWQGTGRAEAVTAHQLGYLTGPRRGAAQWRIPKVPLLRVVIEPGGSIDFAHPDLGFPGHHRRPPAERTLKLWGDDLLSVGHGQDWMFVVDSPVPFDRRWLNLLLGGAATRAVPGLAVVFASFAGLANPGRFRVADVDPTTYTALVHIEDHRT